jgi:hypothetical protein
VRCKDTINRLQESAGLGPVILVSAERELNADAAAAGLTVNGPSTHP